MEFKSFLTTKELLEVAERCTDYDGAKFADCKGCPYENKTEPWDGDLLSGVWITCGDLLIKDLADALKRLTEEK